MRVVWGLRAYITTRLTFHIVQLLKEAMWNDGVWSYHFHNFVLLLPPSSYSIIIAATLQHFMPTPLSLSLFVLTFITLSISNGPCPLHVRTQHYSLLHVSLYLFPTFLSSFFSSHYLFQILCCLPTKTKVSNSPVWRLWAFDSIVDIPYLLMNNW